MGETKTKFALFVEDLRASWYFRIWLVLWVICFIAFLVGFGELTKRSSYGLREPDWRIYFKNYTTSGLQFPRIRFRTAVDLVQFDTNSIYCYLRKDGGLKVPFTPQQCLGFPNTTLNQCFAIDATSTTTYPDKWGVASLDCSFDTLTQAQIVNHAVGWEIDNKDSVGFSATWIRPNNDAWVYINKINIKAKGYPTFTVWNNNLLYHSTVATNSTYFFVQTKIESFLVPTYEEYDFYTGLQAASDFGGFAYFMSLLMTACLIIAGLIFENNSRFLGAEEQTGNSGL